MKKNKQVKRQSTVLPAKSLWLYNKGFVIVVIGVLLLGILSVIWVTSSRAELNGPLGQAGNWSLVFNDEFDGSSLDTANWSTQEPWNTSPGYTPPDGTSNDGWCPIPLPTGNDLVVVNGGTLKLNAKARPTQGKSMQACMVTSRGKQADFTHGYYETRVKIPPGADLWPAFWLLGNDQWPATGEIDIFEFVNNGRDNDAPFFSVHWAGSCDAWNHCDKTVDNPYPAKLTNLSQRFVTFGMLRTSTDLKVYIDGQFMHGFKNTDKNAKGQTLAPVLFNGPMHIRFDLQVGGGWANDPDASAEEGTFEVDYVRVWEPSSGTGDTIAPVVSLTAPTGGETVSGANVALSANATDNVGIIKVDFLINGSIVGTDTTEPYSATWNSALVPNGGHTIAAKAYDAAGNNATSNQVAVTVNNTSTTPPPPPTTPVTSFEAETMSLTSGSGQIMQPDATASANASLLLWSDGIAHKTITTGAVSRIKIKAKGDQCNGAPNMIVRVDGNVIHTVAVSATAWTIYDAPVVLASGSHLLEIAFDNNNPGTATCDRNLWLDTIEIEGTVSAKPGDVDGNGTVNGIDLSKVLTNYGKSSAIRTDGDLNSDGLVNGLDLSQVLTNYGT